MSEENDQQNDEEPNEEEQEEQEEKEEEEEPEAAEASEEEEEKESEDVEQETESTDESPDDEQPEPEVSDSSPDEGSSEHEESEEDGGFEESVVHVNRCCKVVRGGKRFSFSALIVAGNRNGKLSYGFGKANQVPQAIQKAIQDSRERVIDVPIVHGTIPHRVELEYCSTKLLMRPASPGTGVIASLPVRTSVNLAGITDLLTKIYGSTNPINCVKAVYEGLKSLRTKEEIENLRGVKIG